MTTKTSKPKVWLMLIGHSILTTDWFIKWIIKNCFWIHLMGMETSPEWNLCCNSQLGI